MNQILSDVAALPQYIFSVFKENLLPQLTDQQKLVLTISSVVIGVFAALFVIAKCCFKRPSSSNSGGDGFGGGHSSIRSIPSSNTVPLPLPKRSAVSQAAAVVHQAAVFAPRAANPLLPGQRDALDVVEDKINELIGSLAVERQLLESLDSYSATLDDGDRDLISTRHVKTYEIDGITYEYDDVEEDSVDLRAISQQEAVSRKSEIEREIKRLENELEREFEAYPHEVRAYLVNTFSNDYSKKDTRAIYDHLAMLSGFMKKNEGNARFIHECLRQIESFLTASLFNSPTELCLQETKKMDLIAFHEFLSIGNEHIHMIAQSDPVLALKLKLKLANLPLRDQGSTPIDRKALFPNIYLSEQEQVEVLINHFQSEEDKCLSPVIAKIQTRQLSFNDLKKLSKMMSDDRSYLSIENRKQLKNEFEKIMRERPEGKSGEILALFKVKFPGVYLSGANRMFISANPAAAPELTNFHRASKAKQFFAKQRGLPDGMIQIPRWYHTTKRQYVLSIISSGNVRVEHRQAYKGAWVSTQTESSSFGDSVFVFNHRISKLDNGHVFIGYEGGGGGMILKGVRWRGLQCPIPMLDTSNQPHLSLVGIPKSAIKTEKPNIQNALRDVHSTVTSVDQVNYMQREIMKTIGNPNLTEKWWGKADVSRLDRI